MRALLTLFVVAAAAGLQAQALPQFEVDRSWPAVPPGMKIGDASSMAVDAQDRVWLLHRPRTLKPEDAKNAAPPVVVFDTAGKVVQSWGGDGAGFQWPQREHGIHIDDQGFVWIGGNYCPADAQATVQASDDQLLKFTQEGKFVLQIGRAGASKGNADRGNLHRPADQWVNPRTRELFVADGYGNHRVIVFDAGTGQFKRMWGGFGRAPADNDSCAVPPPQPVSGDGPPQFSIVHAIRVANDGTVYVADRENRRVQMFSSDGTFLNPTKPFAVTAAGTSAARRPIPSTISTGETKLNASRAERSPPSPGGKKSAPLMNVTPSCSARTRSSAVSTPRSSQRK